MFSVFEYEQSSDPFDPTEVTRIMEYETIADVTEALGWDDVCLVPIRDERDVFVALALDDLLAQVFGQAALHFWLIAPEDWDVPIDWQFDNIVHNQLGDLQE